MRNALLPYRVHAGLVQHIHEIGEVVRNGPDYLLVPVLTEKPGILRQAPPGTPMPCYLQLATNDGQLRALPSYDLVSYFRMTAKIAHAFAVSQIGIDAFRPTLQSIIIGERPQEWMSYLIGQSKIELPVSSGVPSHQLGLGLVHWGDSYLVLVRVRLFALHRGPANDLIAGELAIPREQFDTRVRALSEASPTRTRLRKSDKVRVRLRRGRSTRVH